MEIITELSPEQILLLISICRYILDPEKVIPSAIGSAVVETSKNILSRLRKPLPDLEKAELESLITEFGEELKRKDLYLASKIDKNRTDIVNYLETTIKGEDETMKNEIKKNAILVQEIVYALKRVEIAKEMGDKRSQALDMNLLGKARLDSNDPETAIGYLEKALEIDEKLGDKRQQAIDLNLLGKAWLDSNDPETAKKYLEKALEIDKEIGDRRHQTIDMNLLGKVSDRLNQPNKAIEYYEEALQISREIEDVKNISYNLHSLGHLYFKRELHVVAEQYFKECTKLPFEINRAGWIDAFESLGDIYRFRGENTEAFKFYKKAHKFSKGKRRERLEKKIHNIE